MRTMMSKSYYNTLNINYVSPLIASCICQHRKEGKPSSCQRDRFFFLLYAPAARNAAGSPFMSYR